MGHYIAATYSDDLSETLSTMMSIPFMYNIKNKIWCNSTQIVIPKDESAPRVERLRIIQLLEADFNSYLKIKVNNQLIPKADSLGMIDEEMYGGIPIRSVSDALFSKILIHDQLKTQKQQGFTLQWDAKECYDRIMTALIHASFERICATISIGRAFSKHKIDMKHKVITNDGLSERYIRSNLGETWTVTCQWNAADGPSWLTIEQPMLNILIKEHKGIVFRSVDEKVKYKNSVLAFIDDNNASRSYDTRIDLNVMKKDAQDITRLWENLIQASGGKLSVNKSTLQMFIWG